MKNIFSNLFLECPLYDQILYSRFGPKYTKLEGYIDLSGMSYRTTASFNNYYLTDGERKKIEELLKEAQKKK